MMKGLWFGIMAGLLASWPVYAPAAEAPAKTKKIVLIGMNRDHGPGEHEYMAGLRLLAECLQETPGIQTVVVKDWPKDSKVLDDADSVVIFLRAGGGYLLQDKARRSKIERVLKKGAGFVALHWAVEGPKEVGKEYMALLGGYYEPGYSTNPTNLATVRPADPNSPIARGWKPFQARDEFYFKIRLEPEARPALIATLTGYDKKVYKDQTIGWVYTRKDSQGPLGPGRSFGFTGCHYHINFGIPAFRRMVVNGILWASDIKVPAGGAPVKLKAPVPKIPSAAETR